MRDARQEPARWQDPRESGKTLTIKSSTARGVGVRNTNVNQTVQAETMSRISLLPQATPLSNCKRLGLCPPPINGVECQRIYKGEFTPFLPHLFFCPRKPHQLVGFSWRAACGRRAPYFYYNTPAAKCQEKN